MEWMNGFSCISEKNRNQNIAHDRVIVENVFDRGSTNGMFSHTINANRMKPNTKKILIECTNNV